MKTDSLTKVVKVMNFHSLLKVDNAKAKADELMNVSSELTNLIQRIIYNKNLILDKNVLKPDPKSPKLSIYIANDLGFCGNFNAVINEQIIKDKDTYKIIIGKQIRYRDNLTILAIEKKDFYEDFKKIEEIITQAILNLTCGYFQSLKDNRIKAKLAHISRYAIARNNQKIDEMVQWLKANDRIPVLINTDGIWFIGAPTNLSSKLLGEFEEDHKNCTLRIKSSGAYEYIEDGKYHPVLRGKTKLDRIKPRDK